MNTLLLNILDKIQSWCVTMREKLIKASLPKGMSASEWAKKNKEYDEKNT